MILGRLYEVLGSRYDGPCERHIMLEGSPDREVHLKCDAPLGRMIWIQLVGNEVTDWHEQDCPEPAPLDSLKRLKVAILRCYRNESDREEAQRKAVEAAAAVESFWRTKGWGVFSVEVRGFALRIDDGDPMPDKSVWCKDSIKDKELEDPDFRDFGADYFHLWGNVSASYCGWGQAPGNYSMTFSTCGVRTMCHEIGHNFGLHHSNGGDGSDDGAEYGNTHCVMGRGTSLSGAQARKLRLVHDGESIDLNKSRRFLMAPLEGNKEDLHPGMFVQARMSFGSRTYVLTMHRDHRLSIERDARKPVRMHTLWWKGDPVTVEVETAKVTYEGFRDGYALVNVDMGDGLGDQSVTIPESIPAARLPDTPSEALSGIFWHPELDGQGFALGELGGDLTLLWYTFNPKSMYKQQGISQRWFRCKLDGKHCTIYTGTREEELRECGSGWLSFADEDNCLFQYRVYDDAFKDGVRNGSVWLQRLTGPMIDSVSSDDGSALMQFELAGKQVTLEQGWREPALDYLMRPVRGDTNQRWELRVDGESWVPESGRFMDPVDPIMD